MSKHKNKRNIPELYRNMEGVIWMVGLAILAIKGWWWPGILILVAISTIYESILMSAYPKQEEEEPVAPVGATPIVPPAAPVSQPATKVEYPTASLPTNCPRCGAPARGHDVHWTSVHSADCAFCGANLPLSKV